MLLSLALLESDHSFSAPMSTESGELVKSCLLSNFHPQAHHHGIPCVLSFGHIIRSVTPSNHPVIGRAVPRLKFISLVEVQSLNPAIPCLKPVPVQVPHPTEVRRLIDAQEQSHLESASLTMNCSQMKYSCKSSFESEPTNPDTSQSI